MRREFFGPDGDTTWCLKWLTENTKNFVHHSIDIRNRQAVLELFSSHRFDFVIHCAAQPSHDLAARRPFDDWDVNATGTLNLLEAARRDAPESPFVFLSTNKVYGTAPNELPRVELGSRFDFSRPEDQNGISEECRIDQSLHSLFGASKAAADILAQEYGRYFDMPVGIFRGGCLTGSHHSGVKLHGFLSFLVKTAVKGGEYTVFGHKGKQVRDNLHAEDVVSAFHQFFLRPRAGEVYNLGGGKENSVSILEAFELVEDLTGRPVRWRYEDEARIGDHICYYSDLRKLKSDYPDWTIKRGVADIVREIITFEQQGR